MKEGWTTGNMPMPEQMIQNNSFPISEELHSLGFRSSIGKPGWSFRVPYWFPIAFFAAMAGLPWYWRYIRFGLRTLLILFTILAALLGYVVWAVRSSVGS